MGFVLIVEEEAYEEVEEEAQKDEAKIQVDDYEGMGSAIPPDIQFAKIQAIYYLRSDH